MQMNTLTIVALIIIVACVAFLVLRRRGWNSLEWSNLSASGAEHRRWSNRRDLNSWKFTPNAFRHKCALTSSV